MASLLERTLEISTPGFDSLLNVIQTETNRIEQNRQLAKQRESQLELYSAQKTIDLANQKAISEFESELQTESRKDIIDYQFDKQVSILDKEQKFERELKMEELLQEQLQAIQEKKNKLQSDFENEFDELIKLGVMPSPDIRMETNEAGIPYLVNKTESGIELPEAYKQKGNLLAHLGSFITTLNDKLSGLAETDSGDNIIVGDTQFVTRNNASEWIQKARRGTLREKVQLAENIRDGRLAPALAYNFPELQDKLNSDPESKLNQQEKDTRTHYSRFRDQFMRSTVLKGKEQSILSEPILRLDPNVSKALSFTDKNGGQIATLNFFKHRSGLFKEAFEQYKQVGKDKGWLTEGDTVGSLGFDEDFKADTEIKENFVNGYKLLSQYASILNEYQRGDTKWSSRERSHLILNKDFSVEDELSDISNMFTIDPIVGNSSESRNSFLNLLNGTNAQLRLDSLNKE